MKNLLKTLNKPPQKTTLYDRYPYNNDKTKINTPPQKKKKKKSPQNPPTPFTYSYNNDTITVYFSIYSFTEYIT